MLGDKFSKWRNEVPKALNLIMDKEQLNGIGLEQWDWLRNPFPPANEDRVTFGKVRKNIGMSDEEFEVKPEILARIQGRPEMRSIHNYVTTALIIDKISDF